MMRSFQKTEWSSKPVADATDGAGNHLVTRNVTETTRGESTVWTGELAIMDDSAYAAYLGSQQGEQKREDAIIDDYTQELIEGGVI